MNQSKYALHSSNQTYILTNTHFRGYWRVFGMQLSSFWSTSPKIYDSWPQISPLLPTTASYNHINQLKYVLISSNQTYLLITTHFSQYKRVFGMLLSDFWSSSPKIDDCWPQISLILLNRDSYNDINQSKYVLTSSNQTYLLISIHFSRYRWFLGKLLSEFWSTSQIIVLFGPKFHLFCSLELHIII